MARTHRFGIGCIAVTLLGATALAVHGEDPTRYRLLEGTTLILFDGAGGVIEVTPLHGTFDLVPSMTADSYLVEQLRGFDSNGLEQVNGGGIYTGGSGLSNHHMILDVRIGFGVYHLDSGDVLNVAGFPMIEIDLVEDPINPGQPYYGLHIIGVPADPAWFSTELPFTATAGYPVSDGDVLTTFGAILWTNAELTANLGIIPPVPDIGLDAFDPEEIDGVPWWEAWFSAEEDIFSESLGWLDDGDFLSEAGFVVARNSDLTQMFLPDPPDELGLDAITWGWWCDGWYFSTEVDFWSNTMGQMVHHGDLLCQRDGMIVFTNADLLANFNPPPIVYDWGLDAVYMWPSGHIWFSVEEGFEDANYGWISDGDLLSRDGWVVWRNLEMLKRFDPIEDLNNFGLDALHVVPVQRGDMNGDTQINSLDIDPFVMALTSPDDEYYELYPELNPRVVGDCNFDGSLNSLDIDPFVALLVGG